jgi:hypothetical protein
MYSYSEDTKIEYWVRDCNGSVVSRHPESSLYYARQEAKSASGSIYEVLLISQAGEDKIVSEQEI